MGERAVLVCYCHCAPGYPGLPVTGSTSIHFWKIHTTLAHVVLGCTFLVFMVINTTNPIIHSFPRSHVVTGPLASDSQSNILSISSLLMLFSFQKLFGARKVFGVEWVLGS